MDKPWVWTSQSGNLFLRGRVDVKCNRLVDWIAVRARIYRIYPIKTDTVPEKVADISNNCYNADSCRSAAQFDVYDDLKTTKAWVTEGYAYITDTAGWDSDGPMDSPVLLWPPGS